MNDYESQPLGRVEVVDSQRSSLKEDLTGGSEGPKSTSEVRRSTTVGLWEDVLLDQENPLRSLDVPMGVFPQRERVAAH